MRNSSYATKYQASTYWKTSINCATLLRITTDWPHQMTIKMRIFLLQSKSWVSTGKTKIYDDVVTYLDQFQAFQDELQDQAKLKWIQDEEFMCISTIKGTWIVISCMILLDNCEDRYHGYESSVKSLEQGHRHRSDSRGRSVLRDRSRSRDRNSSQNYPRSSNSSVTRIMQRNGKYN